MMEKESIVTSPSFTVRITSSVVGLVVLTKAMALGLRMAALSSACACGLLW